MNNTGSESKKMEEIHIPLQMYEYLSRRGDPQTIIIDLITKDILYCKTIFSR